MGGSNLEGEVKKLWDLETLGIKEEESMHETLFNNISFNGTRCSVQLPWKEGHRELPTNFATSRDKNMGLLAQFSTTFTSHLICTQQPQCTRTTFPIELHQAVGKASSGAI